MIARLPLFTTLALGLSITAYQLPALSSLLVFDRLAIERGELWRLLTAHLVHFSTTHLVANALALGMVGGLVERLRLPGSAVLPVVMAICISSTLYILEPDMLVYGGLSGMAYGLATYLALFGLGGSQRYRMISVLVVGALLSVTGRDLLSGQAGTLITRTEPFETAALSHFVGMAVAATVYGCTKIGSRRQTAENEIRHETAEERRSKYGEEPVILQHAVRGLIVDHEVQGFEKQQTRVKNECDRKHC